MNMIADITHTEAVESDDFVEGSIMIEAADELQEFPGQVKVPDDDNFKTISVVVNNESMEDRVVNAPRERVVAVEILTE